MKTAPRLRILATTAVAGILLLIAGCKSPTSETRPSANVMLESRSGSTVTGRLQFMPMAGGIHVQGQVSGLKPNAEHGFHVHEKGDCSAPDAMSAGGHFNPGGAPHGRPDAAGHARHMGDLLSLRADASGTARVDQHLTGATLTTGPQGLSGRSVVVHRDPDDYTSQPAGNSGPRVACGLIN